MKALQTLLVSLVALTIATAQKVGLKNELGFACFNCALNWNFSCPDVVLPYDCRCSRKDFLTTALNCVASRASDINEVVKGWDYIRAQCHYWGSTTMSIGELESIYLQNKDRLVNPLSFDGAASVAPGPVEVPDTMVARQLVSARDTKHHYDVGDDFAWAVIGYWGLIMVIAVITNAIRVICPDVYNIFGTGKVVRLRKFLTLPALAGQSHHSPYRFLRYFSIHFPTRGQFLIILGFAALNISSIVAFLEVKGERPLAFTSQSDRKLHYLANRCGIIAFGHIPVVVLFACRNNPLIYLTGWPYDTFMLYHRWCARFMGTHAIIHAVAIYWSSLNEKVVIFKWENVHNWRGGNLAVYMVIIMLTMGLRPIRSRIYEVFKATHILMFLIFIICLIVHCSDYGWLGWLWASLIFYGGEYICRIAAVIMSGGIQTAQFTLEEGGMYRVKVPGARRKWSVKPGSYVYIRILDKDLFWQSHPFSIFQGADSAMENSLDLCCKAQLGATRITLQKLISTPEKRFSREVLIEGPYGNENYICDYESILLFAGGVGFTAMYNFASHIIRRLKPEQHLSLIWVVRDCQSLRSFEYELAFLNRNSSDMCSFKIYVTRPDKINLGTVAHTGHATGSLSLSDESTSGSADALGQPQNIPLGKVVLVDSAQNEPEEDSLGYANSKQNSGQDPEDACQILVDGDVILNIDFGRPDISASVADFIRVSSGTKAICSCGPPMFVDAIRQGIVESIVESDSRVDYFEDAFSW